MSILINLTDMIDSFYVKYHPIHVKLKNYRFLHKKCNIYLKIKFSDYKLQNAELQKHIFSI